MNWKSIRFFNRNRESESSIDLPEVATSTKAYQSLFKSQLKALREALGEQKFGRVFKKSLHKKTHYLVLESPHANLTELSGHSIANVTPPVKRQAFGSIDRLASNNGSDSRYTLPSWYTDGSALLMGLHFENDVYTANYSYEDTLPLLIETIGSGRKGPCFGGAVIYAHRHDLVSDSTPAWLSKMASLIGQASMLAKQRIPVYIVLEGVGFSSVSMTDSSSFNSLSMPMGMFRDDETVLTEQFGQWFTQAESELTKRLLRKTLKEVQYVHDIESRKTAFSELNAVEQGLKQLKNLSEHLNHRWGFSGNDITPWVRAVFIAPNSSPISNGLTAQVGGTPSTERQSDFGTNHWWQRFSNILLKDRGCGKAEQTRNTRHKLVALSTAAVVILGVGWSQLMWRDYAQAGVLVDQFNEQLLPLSSNGMNAGLIMLPDELTVPDQMLAFDRVLGLLSSIETLDQALQEEKQQAKWLALFTTPIIETQQYVLDVVSDSILMTQFNSAVEQTLVDILDRQHDFEVLYPALKSYLYLHQDRVQRIDYLMWWFGQRWQKDYQGDPNKRGKLAHYLSTFLETQMIVKEIDSQAVSIARAKMLSTPLATRLYFKIKPSGSTSNNISRELKEVIGYRQMEVFDNSSVSLPSFYTKLGYQTLFLPKLNQVVKQASADEWVLEEPENTVKTEVMPGSGLLKKAIYDLYIADYLAAWDRTLNELSVARTSSFDHLNSVVKSANGRDGAIRRMLSYVHENTVYHSARAAASEASIIDGAADMVPTGLAASVNKTTLGLKGVDRFLTQQGIDLIHPMSAVTEHYKPLNSVIDHNAMQEVDQQLVILEEYLSEFEGSTNELDNMSSVFDATVKRAKGSRKDAISQLKRTSKLMPAPLNRWMNSLSDQGWGHMVGRTKRYINKAYQNDIYAFYNANLDNKYPFDSHGEEDVLVDRFSDFFKPEGREQTFVNQYIKPFVRTDNGRWRAKTVDGLSLGFKRDYLSQLQRADTIRNLMFNSRQELHAELQLQPVYLDANISRFDLSIMGERLSYRHGPQKISRISWPATLNEDAIAMRFEDYNGNLVTEEISGEWSLFRLIDQYGKEPAPNGQRFRMSFEVNGQRVVYNIAGRTLSPALLEMLSQYRTPIKPLG